jgi:hypothetical protein
MTTPWRSVKTSANRSPQCGLWEKKGRRDVEGGGSLPNARLYAARLATSGPRLQGGGVTGVRHQIPPILYWTRADRDLFIALYARGPPRVIQWLMNSKPMIDVT